MPHSVERLNLDEIRERVFDAVSTLVKWDFDRTEETFQFVQFLLDSGFEVVSADEFRPGDYPLEAGIKVKCKSTGETSVTEEGDGVRCTRESAAKLIENASVNMHTFHAAQTMLSGLIEFEDPIPPEVRSFAAQILRGEIKKPKKIGRKNKAMKASGIANIVLQCRQYGLNPTRNDVSEPVSGCDLVAEAMAKLGKSPSSYERIKAIWFKHREVGGGVSIDGGSVSIKTEQ